ncbi:MAG: type II toxin-antitoxin system RelE/ParE family toxin [Propionibacteriaceae bacterium]|jgi:mRNA interferase RelE/StbE|nr:type II toxin-antitoxin system RelE/ParE family toxin [Propionibacteriaceae bacterium]
MTYTVEYKRSAEKTLAKLPKATAKKIRAAADALAEEPRPAGVKKLVGADDWRIRVGDYRVIYTIQDRKLIVEVVKIGHRSDIYRKLTK